MVFLAWHYREGMNFFWQRWRRDLAWVNHHLSPFLLLKTMFYPWKRITVEETGHFNLKRSLENFTLNLVSRGMGAAVRFGLFVFGLILLLLVLLGGSIGIILWLIFPFLSLPYFWQEKYSTSSLLKKISRKVAADPAKFKEAVFQNGAGKFVFAHLPEGLSSWLPPVSLAGRDVAGLIFQNYEEAVARYLSFFPQLDEMLRPWGMDRQDFIWAARWWDSKAKRQKISFSFHRSGIGAELIFGYTPKLDFCSSDLAARQSFSHRLIGREQTVSRIERTLTSGKSVILLGQPGVGKKTVVLEFARRASQGELGRQMAYCRVLELDYNQIMAQAVDLSIKKAKLAAIFAEAAAAGNVILVLRDLHRLTCSQVEGYDFTDILEQYLEKGNLKIVAISTPADFEKFLSPNLRLVKYCEEIEVVAPTAEEAMQILLLAAENLEKRRGMTVAVPVLRRILEGADQYLTETPFPEKALELLDLVAAFREKAGGKTVTVEDANAVLAEKTGISFGRLAESEKDKLSRLEEIMAKRFVGQKTAVSLIAKSLRSRKLGVKGADRPVGSFLFLGPTGVGKTQAAKILAQVYFGSESNMIRFDMAEFAGNEGLARLIGSLGQNHPGVLTTAIKNRPVSLLLLDEIEKAPPEIENLFLRLLDEGIITDSFGRSVDCRHLFVIATSNAGAEYIRELVGSGAKGEELQRSVIEYVQRERIFSPEFLNRFDGVVVFEPLLSDELVEIARLQLEERAASLVAQKGITLNITDELCRQVAVDGYDPAFGARPMRRVIDMVLGDLLAKAMLNDEIKEKDQIEILPVGKEQYQIKKIN